MYEEQHIEIVSHSNKTLQFLPRIKGEQNTQTSSRFYVKIF